MDKETRLREIIDFLKHKHSFTNDKLSIALEYQSGTYVSDILGGNKKISPLFLGRLKKHFRVNPDYIELGTLPKILDFSNTGRGGSYLSKRQELKAVDETFMVPLVPVKARAGYVSSYDQTDFLETLERYALPPGINPAGAIWRYFEIEGDSMETTFSKGDIVLSSMVPLEDWQQLRNFYIYVVVTDSQVLIKRLYRKSETKWVMISDNEEHYKQQLLSVTDIKELWVFRRRINSKAPPPKKFEIVV